MRKDASHVASVTAGSLFVCATPIGNLDDITLRVLHTLQTVATIACEDTRHTQKLLHHHAIQTPTLSFHEHNEKERTKQLLGQLQGGQDIALVSDAGMPTVSDPGTQLVARCHQAGIHVEVLPGASAVTTAVALSGFMMPSWRFVGFLPRKDAELVRVLQEQSAFLAFESPKRLLATLATASRLMPDRQIALCRELTKRYEEVDIDSAQALYQRWQGKPVKGEIVLVFSSHEVQEDLLSLAAKEAVAQLVEAGVAARPAAKIVAKLTGSRVNDLYRATLA